MKRTLSFLLLAGCALAVNAQTLRGTWLVDCCFGGLKYSSSNSRTSYSNSDVIENNDRSKFGININPGAAWFVRDNLAIGGGIKLGYSSDNSDISNTGNTFTSSSSATMPSFYIGPMARYYFGGNDHGKLFTQFDFQYGISSEKDKDKNNFNSETTSSSKNNWKTGLSIGYEYFFNPNVGIYGSLGVNYSQGKTEYDYMPSIGTGYTETVNYSRLHIPVQVGLQVHLMCDHRD
jgi:hypothetical protein